jgi:molybdopterin synthase sulfur carrier subunit
MKAVYFAWVRERIGKTDEEIVPPSSVTNIAELIAWLSEKGDGYARAFQNSQTIRAAIDRQHVQHTAAIGNASEIAFFPPMTGG